MDGVDTRGGATKGDWRVLILVVAAGATAVVLAAIWAGLRLAPVTPRVVAGWAQPNAAGTVIGLIDSPDDEGGESYVIAGADWREGTGTWNSGAISPTCVGTDTQALTHVRLGLVTVEIQEGSTREQVVWLECLD